jgi:outer membrane biosynthesis protein TonB
VLLAAEPRSGSRAPTTEVISAPRRQPVALWAGLGGLLVLLGVGGGFWMMRGPAPVPVTPPPTLAQPVPAPPPAVQPAANPTPTPPAQATAQTPAPPAPAVQPTPAPPSSETRPAVASQAEVPAPVQASAGTKPTVRAEKAEGTLRLQMRGWAELWVDDELHGRVPPNVIKLPPGRHLIELRGNPAFEDSQQTVLIRSGKETFLQIDRRPVSTGG